jgi:hypothetical protein
MGWATRRRGLGALVLLTVVATACQTPESDAYVDYAVHHDSVGELVASAEAVVVGRVASTSRGRVFDEEDVVHTLMNVQVVVEQTWAGTLPTPAFTLERFGWERVARRPGWRGLLDPAGERPWRVQDELRLNEGDLGVFFLAREPGPAGWTMLGREGLYLVDGAELADTNRADPTVRTVESMTLAELRAAVAAAVTARGRRAGTRPRGGGGYRPPPPGRPGG